MKFNAHVLMQDGITPHVSTTIELLKADQIIETVLSDENVYYRILEAMEGNYQIRCRISLTKTSTIIQLLMPIPLG